MISKLRAILTRRDKEIFLLLVVLSIFISTIEVVGISAIMPFMSVSLDFNLIHSNEYFSYFYKLVNFDNNMNFVITFGVILIIFYIIRSVINIWYTNKEVLNYKIDENLIYNKKDLLNSWFIVW